MIRKLGRTIVIEDKSAPSAPYVRYPIAAIYRLAWPGVIRDIANAYNS